jgi:hypothetical protein
VTQHHSTCGIKNDWRNGERRQPNFRSVSRREASPPVIFVSFGMGLLLHRLHLPHYTNYRFFFFPKITFQLSL